MKIKNIKLLALVISIIMIISSFTIVTTAAPASYSSASNSGTRNEVCTSLSGTSASSYYTGNYTYDNLIELSASGLKTSLHDLMTNTHKYKTSYNDCRDLVWRTDCEKNDTSHATTLYTSHSMTSSEWSPAWSCNREHVWPKSLGGDSTTGGGSDLHHIRPAEAGVNSSRGNKKYGESTSQGYYEPKDNVKGDVARIILYVHVRWDAAWGATNVTKVFESVDILLEWCELDPVDTWEMGRNEVVQDIQGNRNVFIDYPELAWLMFGKEVPDNMQTPSGSALNGNVPTPPAGGGNDTPDTPVTPNNPTEIPEYLVIKNDSKYVTDKIHNYTTSAGKAKVELELTDNKSAAATFQYIKNSDNTISFKTDSGYLYADGTDVKFVDTIGSNTKFVLEDVGSGYYIKCANATFNGKPQYLEIYAGYLTCYGMGTNTAIYTFTFEQSDNTPVNPNPGGNEKPDTPDNPSGSTNKLATFDFGENIGTTHNDGADAGSSKSFTDGNYTLNLTDLYKVYTGACDLMGNSCIKVGTSSVTGNLSFTVPDDVVEVVLHIAQYKVKTSKVSINGTQYNINTSSNDGAYTTITVDTSATKTVKLATVSGATRVMINTIEFIGATAPDIDDPEDSTEESTEVTTEEITEVTTEEITETTTEESTEVSTEENTEVTTEETTVTSTEATSEEITETPSETDSTEASTETDPVETAPAETEPTETKPTEESSKSELSTNAPTSDKKGCGSTVASGAVIITTLCVGIFATKKKKED